jgi:hypothetical protein
MTGYCGKLHNEELHNWHPSINISRMIKYERDNWVCSMNDRDNKCV